MLGWYSFELRTIRFLRSSKGPSGIYLEISDLTFGVNVESGANAEILLVISNRTQAAGHELCRTSVIAKLVRCG